MLYLKLLIAILSLIKSLINVPNVTKELLFAIISLIY